MNGERFSFRSENNSYRIDDLLIGIKGYSLIQVKGHFPTTVFNDLIELLHLKIICLMTLFQVKAAYLRKRDPCGDIEGLSCLGVELCHSLGSGAFRC